MNRAILTTLAFVAMLTGCKSSRISELTSATGAEAAAYHRANLPADRLASLGRRMRLLDELAALGDSRYEKFIANERLVALLRTYRWNYVAGNTAAADAALAEADKINRRYNFSAISGGDLLDVRNGEEIRRRVDELDAGYAGPR